MGWDTVHNVHFFKPNAIQSCSSNCQTHSPLLPRQVDSLRELSLSTMKSDGSSSCARPMTLDYQASAMAELQQFALHQELEESPVISEVATPSSPPVVKFHEVSHQGSISKL